MTYKKNFVAAVKVDGKILRETQDKVELPFGSEYSILLKNLDTVRMQARISIDGKDATGWLIIPAGHDIDVERFVKDLRSGNRFKFIERTERIEEHRGIGAEDGLVRVEFKREKVFAPLQPACSLYTHYYYPRGCYNWPPTVTYTSGFQNAQGGSFSGNVTNTSSTGMRSGSGAVGAVNLASANLMKSATSDSHSVENENGITVPGSISNQQFHEVLGFQTEDVEVVVLHLVGKVNSKPVKVVNTVHTMLQCETCGRTSKSSAKFCKECGTSLERV